jgi:hypothetical protein
MPDSQSVDIPLPRNDALRIIFLNTAVDEQLFERSRSTVVKRTSATSECWSYRNKIVRNCCCLFSKRDFSDSLFTKEIARMKAFFISLLLFVRSQTVRLTVGIELADIIQAESSSGLGLQKTDLLPIKATSRNRGTQNCGS